MSERKTFTIEVHVSQEMLKDYARLGYSEGDVVEILKREAIRGAGRVLWQAEIDDEPEYGR